MKKYSLTFADAITHKPANPERTARRSSSAGIHSASFGNVSFQVWTSRAAMLKTIEMQERRESRPDDWRASKLD